MGLLADALSKVDARCVVARNTDVLKAEDRADFEAYCEALRARAGTGNRNGPPSIAELRVLLRELDVIVGVDRLGDHISGRCTCGQPR